MAYGLALAALVIAIVALVWAVVKGGGSRGSGGKRGRRGRHGWTGPTGARQPINGMIPYAVYDAGVFGAAEEYAWVAAFGGWTDDLGYVDFPINPTGAGTIAQLDGFSWAAISDGTVQDLQVTLPVGSITYTGTSVYAQVWHQPAPNGLWTATPLIASYQFADTTPTGAACFSNNSDSVSFGPGDRIAVVIGTETGVFTTTTTDDGISAGLGYTLF